MGTNETVLLPIKDSHRDAIANVVFVHGLGGDPRRTWQRDPNALETLWPEWLHEDLNAEVPVNIWSLGYPAEVFQTLFFSRTTDDSVPERARQLAELLTANNLHKRPLIFIAHSLGGILVEQMLRSSADKRHFPETALAQLSMGSSLVLLIATPHSGSSLANVAKRVDEVRDMAAETALTLFGFFPIIGRFARLIVRTGPLTKALALGDPYLADLTAWYRDNAPALGVDTRVYYEKAKTKGIDVVVDETSANPGVSGAVVTAIDADHLEICKPASRDSSLYQRYRASVAEAVNDAPAFHETHLAALDVGKRFRQLTELHPKERMLATKKVVQPIEVRLGRDPDDVDYATSLAESTPVEFGQALQDRAESSPYDLDRVILRVWHEYRGGLPEREPARAIRQESERLRPLLRGSARDITLIPLYYAARALHTQQARGTVTLGDPDRATIQEAIDLVHRRTEDPQDGREIDEDCSTRNKLRQILEDDRSTTQSS